MTDVHPAFKTNGQSMTLLPGVNTGDEFLPAAQYVKRAGVRHYREVNSNVGHIRSPWGDWESTLKETAG